MLAHYMLWYKTPNYGAKWQHWNWDPDGDGGQDAQDHIPNRLNIDGLPDIASAHQPLIGPYDSGDPDLIEYHLALAWATGINGFVVDWYGPGDKGDIDLALTRMFDIVQRWREEYQFRFFIAVTYEEQILLQIDSSEAQEAAAQAHLKYALDKYVTKPGYLRYQDVPLIFFFETWPNGRPGLLRPEQLERIQTKLPQLNLIYMGAEQEFLGVSQGFFSWVSGANENPSDWGQSYADWVYGEMDFQTQQHDLTLNIGSVWAGFDDSKVWGWGESPRFIDRQNGIVYAKTWELAVKDRDNHKRKSPSWVQIITWNDWNEGSEIEPSLQYGYSYLRATQNFVHSYSGREWSPIALKIPEVIYQARKEAPGSKTEAIVTEVYPLFFAGNFEAALAVLRSKKLVE